MAIYKYLDLSTAHITPETDGFLRKQVEEDKPYRPIVYKKDCGYFISVLDESDIDDYEMPDDLRDCLRFAAEHNCNWIILDGDGSTINELKTYEW